MHVQRKLHVTWGLQIIDSEICKYDFTLDNYNLMGASAKQVLHLRKANYQQAALPDTERDEPLPKALKSTSPLTLT